MASKRGSILEWKNYEENISHAFQDMRSRSSLLDVTLGCSQSGGRTLQAHQVILAASSKFFQSVLCQQSAGSTQTASTKPFIYLKGITFENLSLILDFVYNRVVSVPKENLVSFLNVAEELEISGLAKEENVGLATTPELMTSIRRKITEGKALAAKYATQHLNKGSIATKAAIETRTATSFYPPQSIIDTVKRNVRPSKKVIKDEDINMDDEPVNKRHRYATNTLFVKDYSIKVDEMLSDVSRKPVNTDTVYITKENTHKKWTKHTKETNDNTVKRQYKVDLGQNAKNDKTKDEDMNVPKIADKEIGRAMVWPPERDDFIATLYEDNFYIGKVIGKVARNGSVEVDYMNRYVHKENEDNCNQDVYWSWPEQKDMCATFQATVLGVYPSIEAADIGDEDTPVYVLKNYKIMSAMANNSKKIISSTSEK